VNRRERHGNGPPRVGVDEPQRAHRDGAHAVEARHIRHQIERASRDAAAARLLARV
jgi:hypothetical protein